MKSKRILAFFLVIFLLAILSIFYPQLQNLTGHATQQETSKEQAILLRVIDGDTIEINSSEHIRLLGINTPEKKMPFSNESKSFLEQFVNKTILLEKDKEDTDKYQRKLRYIYFENRFLNQEILELGLANSYYSDDLKYKTLLLNSESQARSLKIGVWTQSQDSCSSCIYLKTLNATGEFFIIGNNCSFYCELNGWFVKDAGRNTFYLKPLFANREEIYYSKNNSSIWNNDQDQFFMFDKKGYLVIFYSYKFW